MILVISSPSSSTTGLATLILLMSHYLDSRKYDKNDMTDKRF
jgi:hypothetical protein